MPNLGETIVRPGHLALRYTEMLLKDITPATFARKPQLEGRIIEINHPAFTLGHLALYPARMLEMCGLDSTPAAAPADWADLFSAGKECRDDPDGTIYPAMSQITDRYFSAYRHLLEVLGGISDEVLLRANQGEGRMKEMFPQMSGLANFMVAPHMMSHLGQLSAWRRCFGLGSAM
jgi:hypothetical protein